MKFDEKIGQVNHHTTMWKMTGPAPANVDTD
jgi:hypothetical protein